MVWRRVDRRVEEERWVEESGGMHDVEEDLFMFHHVQMYQRCPTEQPL